MMANINRLRQIREGINSEYLVEDTTLKEEDENMTVPLSRFEKDTVILSPSDDESNQLWACFSKSIDKGIADYIIYAEINELIYAFIVELKKSKTNDSKKKARKQIKSTLPLVKMIYEKITKENPNDLQIIGIRTFGTGGKKAKKRSNQDSLDIDRETEKDGLILISYQQTNYNSPLRSLAHIVNELSAK